MEYIVCEQPGQFLLKEKEIPDQKEKALLKILTVGICGTDLHAYGGNQPFFTYPRILGHELAAEVVKLPSGVDHVNIGDRVAIIPYIHCGLCIACRAGRTNCCQKLQTLGVHTDGGMQSYFPMEAKYLVSANDLTNEEIAIIEPLTIGNHAVRRAALKTGEFAVVVGAGPIGLGIMAIARRHGAKVIAVDVNPGRLAVSKKEMNIADYTVLAGKEAIQQIEEITGGDMATTVFDATGNKYALENGINYMAHGGRYVLVGLSKGNLSFHNPTLHAKEATIMNSRNATPTDFQEVMSMLRNKSFPIDQYITHRVNYKNMINSFESYLDPTANVIKAIVDWDNS